jgi:hypothetical protein
MPSDIKGIFSARLSNFNVSTKGHKVEVTNIETNTTTVYESIFFLYKKILIYINIYNNWKAAKELDTDHSILRRCVNNQKLFKGIYKIKFSSQ